MGSEKEGGRRQRSLLLCQINNTVILLSVKKQNKRKKPKNLDCETRPRTYPVMAFSEHQQPRWECGADGMQVSGLL